MKNKLAKIISAVVAVLMIATLIPASAFAEKVEMPTKGGYYDGVYYDALVMDDETVFYVGQKFGLYCGPANTNLNYFDYDWQVRHATPSDLGNQLEGEIGDAYLTPYYVDGVLCYRLGESPYGASYAGPYMYAYSPVAGSGDIVCIWYDYAGNSYCFVNPLTFVEPESTSYSDLALDVGAAENVISSANFEGDDLTNLANANASSGNSAVATVTNVRIENGQVKYDINAISAGTTRITVTYTGIAHMGPNLFGEYSDVTCTITDYIDVTVTDNSTPTPVPVTPEPVTPEPVTPEPVTPEPVTPEPVTPEPVTPEPVVNTEYTLTYDVNGADTPDTWTESILSEAESYSFTVTDIIPAREGYTFEGWTDATGSAHYVAGDIITLTADAPAITLYAAWTEEPIEDKTSYPGIDKNIVLEGGELTDFASINKNEVVNFRLTSTVPQDLFNYLEPGLVNNPAHNIRGFQNPINSGVYKLAFHDIMAEQLAFNNDVVVKIMDKVIPAELYDVVVNTDDGCTFEVLMDLIEIYEARDENGEPYFTEDDFGTAEITVDYSATSASDIVAGEYQNEAWVEYEQASAPDNLGESEHDIVRVYTCAVDVFKFDQANNAPLAGARFVLGTALNEDGTVGGIVDEGVSDENGSIVFGGHEAGTYYLQEVTAPDGYVCNSEAQTIVLNADLANYTYTIDFANVLIPHTGGEGTILFTVGGAAVMALAVVAYVITRRKNSSVEA